MEGFAKRCRRTTYPKPNTSTWQQKLTHGYDIFLSVLFVKVCNILLGVLGFTNQTEDGHVHRNMNMPSQLLNTLTGTLLQGLGSIQQKNRPRKMFVHIMSTFGTPAELDTDRGA
jgi:hypothetical protein